MDCGRGSEERGGDVREKSEEKIWMEKFNGGGISIMEYVFNYFYYSIVYVIAIFHSGIFVDIFLLQIQPGNDVETTRYSCDSIQLRLNTLKELKNVLTQNVFSLRDTILI
ncbi:hypothetical protein PV325_002656 [Microctonus aethiopoides]|nr:hypothetical protein PV325_002656 [Microctonus aethiopoides]